MLVSCGDLYDGFDISVVSVEPAEYFIIFSIDDDLGEVMFAAIATFLVIRIGFTIRLRPRLINVLRNNGVMIVFYIIL